jgi:hypothetical protein
MSADFLCLPYVWGFNGQDLGNLNDFEHSCIRENAFVQRRNNIPGRKTLFPSSFMRVLPSHHHHENSLTRMEVGAGSDLSFFLQKKRNI